MRALFEIAHQQRFGFISPEKDIEIEAIEVEAGGGGAPIAERDVRSAAEAPAPQPHTHSGRLHPGELARGADLLARRSCAGTHASRGRR